MKKTGIILLFLLIGFTAAWFFIFRTAPSSFTNFPPRGGNVWVAFGDSLTSGFGASEGNDYPTLLSKRIGIPILNLGIPGNTTQDALERLGEVIALHPRVALVCLGGNDALRGVPREQTFQNLSVIIDRIQGTGAFVVLIGIRSATLRDKNEKLFKELAHEKHVLYVPDFLEGILGHPNRMSDYVHPNEEGYAFIANRLENLLAPLLPELRPPER